MESTLDGFDRANEQGKNHDTKGNVANVGNDTLKQNTDDKDLAKKIPTVTPENDKFFKQRARSWRRKFII